jgi:hypothetical protein
MIARPGLDPIRPDIESFHIAFDARAHLTVLSHTVLIFWGHRGMQTREVNHQDETAGDVEYEKAASCRARAYNTYSTHSTDSAAAGEPNAPMSR